MKKVLLFSSLKKPKLILEQSINSWINLKVENELKFDILIYDDEFDKESSNYITALSEENKITIADFDIDFEDNYKGDHKWNITQIDRISIIKNKAINYCLENNYDALFLIDADLVLNTNTLSHLISLNKHFVFEVFWTLFYGENYHKPNAWDFHSWNYHNEETILKLSKKGTFKVGGGGACTLLSREVLQKGLNFKRLESLKYDGEDRHFCTRNQALGFEVFIDTHYPAYHIFNFDQVDEAREWYSNGARSVFFDKWLNNQWKNKVIKSFTKKEDFWSRVRYFQYEVRRAIIKNFKKNFR